MGDSQSCSFKTLFSVTDIIELLGEAKFLCKCLVTAKTEMELIVFQENVALKKVLWDCTPKKFLSQKVPANFPILYSLAV